MRQSIREIKFEELYRVTKEAFEDLKGSSSMPEGKSAICGKPLHNPLAIYCSECK